MLKDILNYIPQIHKEGYVFIAIAILFTLIAFSFSKSIGIILVIITIWCITFFRDPERVTPPDEKLIVSPADGRVDKITLAKPPKELNMGDDQMTRVSVFLSVFDVHVNRIPISGMVKALSYHPGKFLSATLDKSSDVNERQSVLIETEGGINIAVVQIAGLIARRIVCDLDENQQVKAGERFGIIRFGSRVDLYIPKKLTVNVLEGQYMIGGETVIAKLS